MSISSSSLSLHSLTPNPKSNLFSLLSNPSSLPTSYSPKRLEIRCAKRSQRTGKFRYPSEKKKLKQIHKQKMEVKDKFEGFWRLSKLGVEVDKDPGKDFLGVSHALLEQIAKVASLLPAEAFTVVRKSFDARKLLKTPKFVYTVDMNVEKLLSSEPRLWDFISEMEPKVGLVEHIPQEKAVGDLFSLLNDCKKDLEGTVAGDADSHCNIPSHKPKVAVVGSGPAGLFATLVLGELGADVTLIERGQPVEQRGRDIGALVVRRIIQSESNFCFGEGGAGTWSDGKLVTRIGKNSDSVQAVLRTLVHFGAPRSILVDGKPHLGTDRLVPLLRSFRQHLQALGVTIKFGTRVDDLLVEGATIKGVKVSDVTKNPPIHSQELSYDAVVLAVGHSARDVYQMLLSHNVGLVPKDFAIGLRVEHPQQLINSIQYAALAAEVQGGRGKVPVADYKIANYLSGEGAESSYSSASRGCYSFCMCPGGQVVLTSTNPSELCINGMSFSRRSSKWANSALVVTVSSKDFESLNFHGALAGVDFQRELEQRAAVMGGGNFVVPVQTVTDFLEERTSGMCLPQSSYRLGVKASNLHELFPAHLTKALQDSILMFEKELPGFISKEALLHGVETRTSSPVQIPRNSTTFESTNLNGLYPVGEGAGFAGGIVSAAVDGLYAGFAAAKNLGLITADIESLLGKAQNSGIAKY
uniref:FAD-binding domain-containing protein n=1 Tax=Chenopodium quinoa TaxID=63459 RepID=A0A803MFD8_CHEQI